MQLLENQILNLINLVRQLNNNIMNLIIININVSCIILGIYYCPDLKEYDQIIEYIQSLPLVTKPDIFGLHENADLIKERQESELLLNSVLKTQVN